MKSTLQVLIDARKLVERPEKWLQNCGNRDGRRCSGYALCDAAEVSQAPNDAFRAFQRVIGDDNIPRWNDAPHRTHAEVLAAFDRAIAAERAKLDKIGAQVQALITGALRDDLGTISPDRAAGKPRKRSLVNHT